MSIQDALASIASLPADVLTAALNRLTASIKAHRQKQALRRYGIKDGDWVFVPGRGWTQV